MHHAKWTYVWSEPRATHFWEIIRPVIFLSVHCEDVARELAAANLTKKNVWDGSGMYEVEKRTVQAFRIDVCVTSTDEDTQGHSCTSRALSQ